MIKRRRTGRHPLRDLAEDLEDVARAHPCAHQVRLAVQSCVEHICAVAGAHEANERALKADDKLEKIATQLKRTKK